MFAALIFFAIFLAASFLSAEGIITMIIGGLVSMGISQWVKKATQAYGPAMLIISVIISVLVAVIGIVAASFLTGSELHWQDLSQLGPQVFALATIAYKLFLADSEPAN